MFIWEDIHLRNKLFHLLPWDDMTRSYSMLVSIPGQLPVTCMQYCKQREAGRDWMWCAHWESLLQGGNVLHLAIHGTPFTPYTELSETWKEVWLVRLWNWNVQTPTLQHLKFCSMKTPQLSQSISSSLLLCLEFSCSSGPTSRTLHLQTSVAVVQRNESTESK